MVKKKALGKNGPEVSSLGYGAMVLEGFYGSINDDEAIRTIKSALDAGFTMLDTADAYGNGHNEIIIGKAVKNRRQEAFIATKFGIVFDSGETGSDLPTNWGFSLKINGRSDYVKKCLSDSLKRLGTDTVDLWYLHYPDPSVPIEDTVGAMAEEVNAGRVRSIGLSNVTAEQVHRASKVHPIAAVQNEYSLFNRKAETSLLPALRNLGIALVAWSPLGAGFLTGTVDKLDKNDFRMNNPRFSVDNLRANKDRFAPLMKTAEELNITPAQLALAWLLHMGEDIFPIPGTRKTERLAENAAAAEVVLKPELIKKIDEIARLDLAQGATLL